MNENSKMVLKIGLILFIIMSIISVLYNLNVEILNTIHSKVYVSIPITTIILLAYVWDRGEDSLAKFGLGCIVGSLVLGIIGNFALELSLTRETLIYNIYQCIRAIFSGLASLSGLLALFSLIPNKPNIDIYKKAAIGLSLLSILLKVINSFTTIGYESSIYNFLTTLPLTLETVAEYTFIILYLLGKTKAAQSEVEAKQQTTQQVQQPVQPMPQMPQQVQQVQQPVQPMPQTQNIQQ